MSITVNSKTYSFDSQRSADAMRYNGPSQTLGVKDYFDAKRTAPKPTATFAGQAKAEAKLTRSLTNGTSPVGDGIITISVSFPAAAASTQVDSMLGDMAAWFATASATSLLRDHDVTQ